MSWQHLAMQSPLSPGLKVEHLSIHESVYHRSKVDDTYVNARGDTLLTRWIAFRFLRTLRGPIEMLPAGQSEDRLPKGLTRLEIRPSPRFRVVPVECPDAEMEGSTIVPLPAVEKEKAEEVLCKALDGLEGLEYLEVPMEWASETVRKCAEKGVELVVL
jgi:hypothetical protein